jgi:transcriptional regulator with XRE-family HTH domain
MTPFGARLRRWRAERGVTLQDMAAAMQVSSAYLSALEHGRRGAPSVGLVHQVCEYLGLIWDDADELGRLAKLSRPRVVLDAAGLTPEATELANRLADSLRSLPPEKVAALRAVLGDHAGVQKARAVGACGLQETLPPDHSFTAPSLGPVPPPRPGKWRQRRA